MVPAVTPVHDKTTKSADADSLCHAPGAAGTLPCLKRELAAPFAVPILQGFGAKGTRLLVVERSRRLLETVKQRSDKMGLCIFRLWYPPFCPQCGVIRTVTLHPIH